MNFEFIQFDPEPSSSPDLRGSFFARGRIPYATDKILPNGLVVVVFNMGAPHRVGNEPHPEANRSFGHSWLHGVQTTPVFNTPGGETHVFGLLFEPVGFHRLFGTDMTTIVDRTVDARDLLPGELVRELDRARSSAGDTAGHARIHAALGAHGPRRDPPAWIDGLYRSIGASDGRLRLATEYRRIGLSQRRISARFKLATGVSPKVLCRIHRLNALLGEIDPAGPVNWTELAHAAGFFDQAHFNHEFRRFSGLTPGAFLDRRRRDLPDLAKGESVSFSPER